MCSYSDFKDLKGSWREPLTGESFFFHLLHRCENIACTWSGIAHLVLEWLETNGWHIDTVFIFSSLDRYSWNIYLGFCMTENPQLAQLQSPMGLSCSAPLAYHVFHIYIWTRKSVTKDNWPLTFFSCSPCVCAALIWVVPFSPPQKTHTLDDMYNSELHPGVYSFCPAIEKQHFQETPHESLHLENESSRTKIKQCRKWMKVMWYDQIQINFKV